MADSTVRRGHRVRFGLFDLDVRSGELRKRGIRQRLPEQPFRILLLLLEHHGELVTRGEIRLRLWPNETMVEFDHGINAAVRKLREALGDTADEPRYIETLARRGYRFLASIEVEEPSSSTSDPSPDTAVAPAVVIPPQSLLDDIEGKRISHYLVLDKLGSGGMGVVFRAKDLSLNRYVALKFLPDEYRQHSEPLDRFHQEARTAASLNHPNICTVYEIGEHQGQPFIAMELLEGQTVRELVAEAPIAASEVVRLGIQMAEALEAAHKRGIVHRDIKSANVFVTWRKQAKILDFSLAKLLPERSVFPTQDSTAQVSARDSDQTLDAAWPVGTVSYMSPEQLRGEDVGPCSDIFSLGVVLYEMASGKRAFDGDSSTETMRAILTCDPPQFSNSVPAALDRVVRRCLEKQPARRFQSAADLGFGLSALQAHPPEELGPRRMSYMAWSAIAVTLASAAVVARLFWSLPVRDSPAAHWDHIQVSRLTASGNVQGAALSPDGHFVVYSTVNKRGAALRLRNLETGSDSEIGAVSGVRSTGLTISPDGKDVYFVQGPDFAPGILSKIPIKGGVATQVSPAVSSTPSFSPTGKEFVFSRDDGLAGIDQIVMVGSDHHEKIIAQFQFPLLARDPAWSPHGDIIAYGATPKRYFKWGLLTQAAFPHAPVQGNTPAEWYFVGSVAWINDGRAILFAAQSWHFGEFQLWKLAYPTGQPQRITYDLNSYSGLSASADSRVLVSVRRESVSQMSIIQTDAKIPGEGIQHITNISPSFEGRDGLSFTGDGRLVFASAASGSGELWMMDADGSHKQQLTNTGARNSSYSLSADGRVLVTFSNRGGGANIWRMNSDGTDARQLTTSGADIQPTISPDGQWIAYVSLAAGKRLLRKMNADGSHQVDLSNIPTSPWPPAISPDGRRVAFTTYDPAARSVQMVIIDSSGKPVFRANLAAPGMLKWSPFGDAVSYIRATDGSDHVWAQPLSGELPRQITHLHEGRIYRFAWSPDGKKLAIVHGNTTSDLVLLESAK